MPLRGHGKQRGNSQRFVVFTCHYWSLFCLRLTVVAVYAHLSALRFRPSR